MEAKDSQSTIVKEAAELVKAAADLVRVDLQGPDPKKSATRGGPILLAGRLILGFAFMLALASSASAYFDLKAAAFQYPNPKAGTVLPNPLSATTTWLRVSLGILACSAVGGTGWLIYFLARKNPYLLNS